MLQKPCVSRLQVDKLIEKCREGTDDVPGNPDCQALYGSGTLALALGMNNFDSIAFQINFNDGYAMTIPEIAQNFYVIDDQKEGDGADKIATISCNNKKCIKGGRIGCAGGDDKKLCNHPTFAIHR